jgi:Leucine-rich repeat (LRR) protein
MEYLYKTFKDKIMYDKYLKSLTAITFLACSAPAVATEALDSGESLELNQNTYTVPSLKELALLKLLNACPAKDVETSLSGLPTDLIDEAKEFIHPSNYEVLQQYNTLGRLTGDVFKSFKEDLAYAEKCGEDIAATRPTITLEFCNKNITNFPKTICQQTDLKTLCLISNKFAYLPTDIYRLSKLTQLKIDNNQLRTLPPEIGRLTSLTYFSLPGNQLKSLPEEIEHLTHLQKLNLTGNKLTSLPEKIGQLSNLQELYLDGNQLATLPAEIGKLTKLYMLSVKGNDLTSLPAEIGQLTQLRYLNLDNNQLTALPEELGQLTNLKTLKIDGNPLSSLPLLQDE